MSAKEQIASIVNRFKKEPYLKDKTDLMGDGLLLGGNLADEANERSVDSKTTVLAIQEKYKEQILAQDLNPNKDPELVDLRGGSATAGERMTAFEQSTTAQFQQTEALVSKNSFFNTNDMRLLAHRGFSSIAPENSLPACELAGEYGYWGVEFDVFFTTDNVPVIIHDDTVDRTTNGVGKIEEMTFSQVQALKIDFGEKIEMYENLKIPTLVEYLEISKKHNIIPIIEIKQGSSTNANLDKMIEIIKNHGFEENCIVISFYKEHLTYVRSVNKKITLAPLIPITSENIEFVLSLGNSLIDPYSPTLTKELIEQCHSKGIKVITWTVDDVTEKNRLMKLGVDFLTTNSLVEGV